MHGDRQPIERVPVHALLLGARRRGHDLSPMVALLVGIGGNDRSGLTASEEKRQRAARSNTAGTSSRATAGAPSSPRSAAAVGRGWSASIRLGPELQRSA